MPAAELTFELLDGPAARAGVPGLLELQAEAAGLAGPDRFAGRLEVQARQPGFAVAVARSGGYLIGGAAGLPLRPSTSWWRDLTTPLPDEVTTEHPGRTFALTTLVVRPSWRRQRIGGALHDLLLASRAEERATAIVVPSATAAQAALHSWGWARIARIRGASAGDPAPDVLVRALPLRS